MATTRTDEDENLNVTSNDDDVICTFEKVGGRPFVREQDEAIVHNETSRDNKNIAAPSGTAESLLFASMQHNAEMIKAFTNTFVTLQKQLCPIPTEIISDKKRKSTSTSDSSLGSTSSTKTRKVNEDKDKERDDFDEIIDSSES